ncbi:MAG: hypothetical protein IPK63_12550 [Candidatus Competibacteraceae bacterium]|nr:hypothetical protein [Candidatus Competibacteraceae bacterium]
MACFHFGFAENARIVDNPLVVRLTGLGKGATAPKQPLTNRALKQNGSDSAAVIEKTVD